MVYYGKYLGFLERARTEYLEGRGIKLVELMNEGIYFVVVHVDVTYKMPARYGEILSVSSEIVDVTVASITFNHRIIRKDTDNLIATASVKLACIGAHMKPQRINKNIIDVLTEG